MRTRVKVCGITRVEDAQLAVRLGAAALGFNFYSRSPRSIAPRVARSIIEGLPPFVTAVGVYADETDAQHVIGIARQAGVQILQLHGPQFPEPDGALADYSIIRAVTVGEDFDAAMLAGLRAEAFLLDAFHPELKGGTGKTFDWTLARKAAEYGTIILAGGLNPENVGEAIAEVRPFAVDVASGVESAPGKKDAEKLGAFFAAVEEADRQF
jgi:phosphoribosylanthranilate isomerase